MNISDYFDGHFNALHDLTDYASSPCKVFLSEVSGIFDAVAYCKKNLPKSKRKLTYKSESALNQITIAALGTMMGQFELFQRFSFSTAFELTRYINKFDLDRCVKSLQKDAGLQLDLLHLSAYRGQPVPIGQLIADNLTGWHVPIKVNQYMNSICHKLSFFSNDEAKLLCVLWQLRHTSVHTGGWLTLPDSQKAPELSEHGDKAIFLNDDFIEALARKFHSIAALTTSRLSKALSENMSEELVNSKEFKKFTKIHSPKRSWLPQIQ